MVEYANRAFKLSLNKATVEKIDCKPCNHHQPVIGTQFTEKLKSEDM